MHARHRSPGNGIRSNSVGLGGLAAARISSESSMRMHGMHNSDYRYSRGLGRGSPKSHLSLQAPRKGDIFMEAGRLAAEYLVSQGVLSPTLLPGKWHNVSLKNQSADLPELQMQDRDGLQLQSEGRTSVLARLGDVIPDVGSGRRRLPDEFNTAGLRNHQRGRKRMGSYRGHVSDWGRENGRNGSWSDKTRVSPGAERDEDFISGYHEEQQHNLNGSGGRSRIIHHELLSKVDVVGGVESGVENYEFFHNASATASSFEASKELTSPLDEESPKASDGSDNSHPKIDELTNMINNDDPKEQSLMEDFVSSGALGKNNNDDLLKLCNFAKVPTRTRSSLTCKGPKVESIQIIDGISTCEVSGLEVRKETMDESPIEQVSSSTNQNHSPKCVVTDTSEAPSIKSIEDIGDLGNLHVTESDECMSLQSFPNKSVIYERASGRSPSGLGDCNSMVKERVEKRAISDEGSGGETKKPREWISSMVAHANEDFQVDNFHVKSSDSSENSLSPDEVVKAIDQDRFPSVALYPSSVLDSSVGLKEEKQLFPSSFKICDLNLMESNDIAESHERIPIPSLPSPMEAKNEVPVDVDLSISNNHNRCDDYGRHSTDAAEVVVVDLEDDPMKEDEDFNTSERKIETTPSTMESFPNHMANAGDLPDAQDGYGLMISELLGNDISSCSSVPAEITGLHPEIGLHNGAGILGDDDPIYLSLGEIPISFLGVWEQPTQQYEKPF